MFIEAVVLGLIATIFFRGRIDNFNYLEIKVWYLIILGLMMQLIPVFLSGYKFLTYIQLIGIIFVLIAVVLNLKVSGFWIILLGGLLNFIAVLLNSFKMPVNIIIGNGTKLNGLIETIINGDVVNYVISTTETLPAILGKIIMTPDWYPFPKLLSAGDILISIGIFIFILGESRRKNFKRKSKMVQYTYKSRI